MVKHQHNFCLLLQEVLKTTPYVFTHEEETFLEIYLLLSNDSQRLLIRLYIRKGPWFQLSRISNYLMKMRLHFCHYAAIGYLCYVKTTRELDKDDLETEV